MEEASRVLEYLDTVSGGSIAKYNRVLNTWDENRRLIGVGPVI